jgi:ribosomal protein L4
MKYEIRNFENKKVGELQLNPDIFSAPLRQDILARMVHWQLGKASGRNPFHQGC